MKNLLNLCLVLTALIAVNLGCTDDRNGNSGTGNQGASGKANAKEAKLDSYTIKGIKFAYYKIPSGLGREDLIKTAQKIHDAEPDTQLILVDDDSKVKEYIAYVKAISGQGDIDKAQLPQEWADKHIVANVQKYTSGRFVLCESNGSVEIADLK